MQTKRFNLSSVKSWSVLCILISKTLARLCFTSFTSKKGGHQLESEILRQQRLGSYGDLHFLCVPLCDFLLQELVDVYVEFPFFVRGCGWSSCSPQRTARLCGLQCRQLSVGDVCLALTPAATPQVQCQAEVGSGELVQGQESSVDQRLEQPFRRPKWSTRRRHQSAP